MNKEKKLIILIPHFNNPKALKDTSLSIKESFPIDVLVVDDGSRTKPNEK